MRTVNLKGHHVLLYTSIEELPVVRFHKYNKCLLLDAGIGSDLTALDGHIERVVQFIKQNKREEAGTELENLRQNVFMMMQEMSPRMMAFACLVKEIDGKDADDMSDDGLQRIVGMLSDVPVGEMTAQMDAVKKKIDDELTVCYPSIFDDSSSKEYYDILKERTKVMLDSILEGETDDKKRNIEELTTKLVTFSKPQKYVGTESMEIAYDRRFDDMCIVIGRELNMEAKRMTVMEYYNAYLFIEKDRKRQKTQNKAR